MGCWNSHWIVWASGYSHHWWTTRRLYVSKCDEKNHLHFFACFGSGYFVWQVAASEETHSCAKPHVSSRVAAERCSFTPWGWSCYQGSTKSFSFFPLFKCGILIYICIYKCQCNTWDGSAYIHTHTHTHTLSCACRGRINVSLHADAICENASCTFLY